MNKLMKQARDLRCNLINEKIKYIDIDEELKDQTFIIVHDYLEKVGPRLPRSHTVLAAGALYIAAKIQAKRYPLYKVAYLLHLGTEQSVSNGCKEIAKTLGIKIGIKIK